MNNNWTIKELNKLDDFAFAARILSERLYTLNQESPLAKKLKKTCCVLEELHDMCRENPYLTIGIVSPKHAIYQAVAHEHLLEDIKAQIGDCDLSGLEPSEVLSDKKMVSRILERFDKRGCGDDYWIRIERSIENGIRDTLEAALENRKDEQFAGQA
jgi:hypothetical protein